MFSGGYMGRLCWIDLSKQSFAIESLPEELARDFIGGGRSSY